MNNEVFYLHLLLPTKVMTDDCKIYVGSLSYQTSNEGLAQHFQQIGEVVDGEWIVVSRPEKMKGRSTCVV